VKQINLSKIFKSNTNKLNLTPKNLTLCINLVSSFYLISSLLSSTQNDLDSALEEIELQQNELSRLHEQLTQSEQTQIQIQNELEQTKQYSQQLESQLFDKDESKKNVDLLIDQYRQQLSNEKDLRLSKRFTSIILHSFLCFLIETDTELENVRSKLLQLTNDYEQLNTNKKEFETNELNTRRKIDETNRSRQAVLDRTRDEYEKLLRKYTDLDEVYRELIDLRGKDTCKDKIYSSN
jgi:septal ring factor EnvC (AmiA/AmiB activator)